MSLETDTNTNILTKVFENYEIEIMYTNIDENKKEFYFKANDIGTILNIKKMTKSVHEFDDDERVYYKNIQVPPIGGYLKGVQPETIFLTSRGVYRLLYTSRKPVAKIFRKWVGKIQSSQMFRHTGSKVCARIKKNNSRLASALDQ